MADYGTDAEKAQATDVFKMLCRREQQSGPDDVACR